MGEDQKKKLGNHHNNARATKLRANIVPGSVLILLAGHFKGQRVVFLNQLPPAPCAPVIRDRYFHHCRCLLRQGAEGGQRRLLQEAQGREEEERRALLRGKGEGEDPFRRVPKGNPEAGRRQARRRHRQGRPAQGIPLIEVLPQERRQAPPNDLLSVGALKESVVVDSSRKLLSKT